MNDVLARHREAAAKRQAAKPVDTGQSSQFTPLTATLVACSKVVSRSIISMIGCSRCGRWTPTLVASLTACSPICELGRLMDPRNLSDEELHALLMRLNAQKQEQEKLKKLEDYQPYLKQQEFHALGDKYRERLFSAGNQLGKTYSGAAELSMHLTGRYPPWWRGRRWSRPTSCCFIVVPHVLDRHLDDDAVIARVLEEVGRDAPLDVAARRHAA